MDDAQTRIGKIQESITFEALSGEGDRKRLRSLNVKMKVGWVIQGQV